MVISSKLKIPVIIIVKRCSLAVSTTLELLVRELHVLVAPHLICFPASCQRQSILPLLIEILSFLIST